MNRLIVLGGQGWFGRTLVEELRNVGLSPLVAGRSFPANIIVNADDADSLRAAFQPGDLLIDAAGPFQRRSLALLKAAIDIGFDVIDINDNLSYAEQVVALEAEIASAGIRVLSSASSVSAVAAALVQESGAANPLHVSCFLAPASRHTANRGSALSLIQSVGCPVRALRNGQLQTLRGWSEKRQFPIPAPVGTITGRLFESADAIYLPRIWPSLQQVDMFVDTNTPGINMLLCGAARFPPLRSLLSHSVNLGTKLSRIIGSHAGGIGYEIQGTGGQTLRLALLSKENSFVIAVAPAILAAQAIASGNFQPTGLVLPHQQVKPAQLWDFLKTKGIEIARLS